MDIFGKISIYFNYKKIGKDKHGNSYYIAKKEINPDTYKLKRVVLYNGIAEPSKIPSVWHSWMHYLVDNIPCEDSSSDEKSTKYSWQKDRTPNLTGTKLAKFPSGHIMKGSARDKVSSDYKAWTPNN